jgi:hypothetical protein
MFALRRFSIRIAAIYELVESDGMHFIVMEHVEGETLEA